MLMMPSSYYCNLWSRLHAGEPVYVSQLFCQPRGIKGMSTAPDQARIRSWQRFGQKLVCTAGQPMLPLKVHEA